MLTVDIWTKDRTFRNSNIRTKKEIVNATSWKINSNRTINKDRLNSLINKLSWTTKLIFRKNNNKYERETSRINSLLQYLNNKIKKLIKLKN